MPSPATSPPKGGWTPIGDTGEGGRSRQARWIPGVGQAKALTAAAAARGTKPGTRRAWKRAELLREVVAWGLTRPADEVRAQGPVPAEHDSADLVNKQVTVIPAAGDLAKLDRQAAEVEVKRNELLRRHAAAWLAREVSL